MNLLKIRYFITAARCSSFSEAARQLYTTQPNLSKQIAQMEQELGFPLFVRARTALKLTPAGAVLYEDLKHLPDQLDSIFEKARAVARRGEESLCIGVLEGQDVNEVLRSRLAEVSRQHPGLQITLERSSYHLLRSGLRSGHYDLIITLNFDVEEEPDLELFTLYRKEPAIAMRRDNPMAQREHLTLWDLREEPFVVISREASPGGNRKLKTSCAAEGFTPKIVREPESLESLLLCVEMGMGIAILDQNTRLETSPDVVTIPQNTAPMAVVMVIRRDEPKALIRDVVRLLGRPAPEESGASGTASP